MDQRPMIEHEIREILQALLTDTGSISAAIVSDDGHLGVPCKRRPLGGDRTLQVELPSRTRKDDSDGERSELSVDARLEIAVRQLRALARRWNAAQLPLVRVPAGSASSLPLPSPERVIHRIEAFLRALVGSASARNALLVRRSQLVAAASAVAEPWASRVSFLARRAWAAAPANSSHGEVIDPDAFALAFYYDAVLIVVIDAPYAVDFLRHRCRMVVRELALLLPMLEPDPETPAMTRDPS
jgi:hypothetical protein